MQGFREMQGNQLWGHVACAEILGGVTCLMPSAAALVARGGKPKAESSIGATSRPVLITESS